MELLQKMLERRSVRTYNGNPVPEDKLQLILQAGLASPSSRAIRPWEFILVKDKEMLGKLSQIRTSSAQMLSQADCAIVVIADASKSDVWIEDCSNAMAGMHLMADSLGVGSCWVQGRERMAPGGRTTEEAARELLHFPETYKLEAILSLGMTDRHPQGYTTASLLTEKIHHETF